MLDQFWDERDSGFFFTGAVPRAKLIARNKDPHDNATPSGNAMADHADCCGWAKLTGRADLLARAETTLKLFRRLDGHPPDGRGPDAQRPGLLPWSCRGGGHRRRTDRRRLAAGRYGQPVASSNRTELVVAFKPTGTADADYRGYPVAGRQASSGCGNGVRLCANFACQAPLVGADAAVAALGG